MAARPTSGIAGEERERYRLVRRLSVASSSVVYLAHDHETEDRVAILAIAAGSDRAGASAAHAAVFSERQPLRHAALARWLDFQDHARLGRRETARYARGIVDPAVSKRESSRRRAAASTDDEPTRLELDPLAACAIVLEWPAGETVQEPGAGPLASDALAYLALELARLTDELHARDQSILLHPSQLRWRITGGVRALVVVETDPAPVHPAQVAALIADHRAYLAPELRSGATPDRRADLYALGATLFTLATGSSPPDSPATRRGQARLALPTGLGALADVLGRLLATDPAERLAHAAEVVERLGARPARRSAPRGELLLSTPLVGRAKELEALDTALAATGPGAVFVRGPAGSGTSALLACATSRVVGRRVQTAAFAPGVERFDAAYAALARAVELDVPAPDRLSATSRRVRAFDRLGRALASAAVRAGGLVVALDDMRHADAWGLAWVEHFVRQAGSAGQPVRLAAAVLAGGPASDLADRLVADGLACVVEVDPLDDDALATLVASWLGARDPPRRLASALALASAGRPMVAREILADAVEAGRIYRDGARWVVDAVDPLLVPLARRFEAAVSARWARLREPERALAGALAVAVEPQGAVALGARLGRDPAELAQGLARLARAGWLARTVGLEGGFAYAVAGSTRRAVVVGLAAAADAALGVSAAQDGGAVDGPGAALAARMRLLGHPSVCDQSATQDDASAGPVIGGTPRFHRARAIDRLAAGQFDSALEDTAAASGAAVDAEDFLEIALAGLATGEVLRAMGDLEAARTHADHAVALGLRWRDEVVRGLALALRGRVTADEGAHLAAVADLEAAALALADADRADAPHDPATSARRVSLAASRVCLDLADALVRAEAPGRAERELARARALRGGAVAPPDDQVVEAHVAAELALGAGDLPRARAILEGARAASALPPTAEAAWRLALALARALAALGDGDASAAVRAEAERALAANALALGTARGERYLATGRRLDRGRAVVAAAPEVLDAPRAAPGNRDGAGYAKLLEINKELALERDLDPLLVRIMDTAIELLGAERGVLVLGGDGPGAVALARDYQRRTIDHAASEISRSIVARVIATGQALLSTNASEDDRLDAFHSVSELRLRSVLCVPLDAGGQRLGALYLDNRFEKGIFGGPQKELLGAFAGQAALAIARARLMDENQRRADEIAGLNQQLSQEVRAQGDELVAIKAELAGARVLKHEYGEIVGRSEAMRRVLERIDRATEHALPVFVHGESGTGKELVARAIHANGPRRGARFVVENCAAVAESLLEAELFGYVKGAFTGATHDKPGLFELADGGTIFLDEVGDMSVGMQKSLLRVLQEGEVRRVGGKAPVKVDARVISASNKDLAKLVAAGAFREDLYYRLDVLRIDLPPLRDRKDDIPELVERVLEDWSATHGMPRRRVSREALELLVAHDWPGNVRELKNAVMGALSLADADTLAPRDFALKLPAARRASVSAGGGEPPMLSLDDYTRWFVERFQGELNDTELAKKLGISRKTLWEKRKRFGIAKG